MYKVVDYECIDKKEINENHILIDLRSPSEYKSETIPGAINLPIFSDEERKIVGTIYKQESVEKAKKVGIEFIANRLPSIYEEVNKLDQSYHDLVFFCARGGFRSSSLVALFKSLGINAIKLDNGYKGYRKYINEQLPIMIEKIQFIVLYGNTGTGKTDILKCLKEEGMDILDLEGCANHRGSTLGSVGLGEQNTQKLFESLIYSSLSKRKTNLVFIEGESKRIGKDIIPDYLFQAMNNAIKIKIEAHMERRVDNILKDYVHETDDELITALNYLRKYLGDSNIDLYIESINHHEYKKVIEELMIKYYDPMYEHKNRVYDAIFYNEETLKVANDIINWAKNIKKNYK